MGDAPLSPEHVLVIFYPTMPEEVKEVILQKFSHAEVTIYESQGTPVPSGKWLSFLKIEVTKTKLAQRYIKRPPSSRLSAIFLLSRTRRSKLLPQSFLLCINHYYSLKLIHTFSAGVDHILQNPILQETDIPITTSSGIHGPPIAEWTVMNWLVSSRRYAKGYEAQKSHVWDKAAYRPGLHDQVGKKVGILGYGSIGRQSMFPHIHSLEIP